MDGPRAAGQATWASPASGTVLAPPLPPSSGALAPERRGLTRRVRMVALIALALVAVVLALLGASIAQARTEERQVTRQLDQSQMVLGSANAALATTGAHLRASAASNVHQQAALATATAQLASVRDQLSSAQKNLFVQGVSIAAVDTCLGGVEAALNQIAVNDPSGAAASLNQVSTSCKSAEASGG
jgi:Tfp pilus assembly protein PilX